MSATETLDPPQLRCPHCQAGVVAEQDWCLECGSALRRRIVASPAARRNSLLLPLLAVAVIGTAAGFGLWTFLGASDPASSPSVVQTEEPQTTEEEPATGVPAAKPWPRGEEAYTVVLMATASRADAEERARALAAAGADAGVLESDRYRSFRPAQWIVWRGRYRLRAKAEEALGLIEETGNSGYITFVRPRSG